MQLRVPSNVREGGARVCKCQQASQLSWISCTTAFEPSSLFQHCRSAAVLQVPARSVAKEDGGENWVLEACASRPNCLIFRRVGVEHAALLDSAMPPRFPTACYCMPLHIGSGPPNIVGAAQMP